MSTINLQSEQPAVRLSSERLAVELAAPGSIYRGTRFDWTGFISQVTLDGRHTFCVPESLEPGQGTGGIGLCNEFGIEMAIGYADAKPGDCFPKLGIGLLVRSDDQDYSFMHPYEIAQLFPVQVEGQDDKASIVVESVDCRGYAARLAKTFAVRGNQLEIAYQLENTGQQPVATREYAHNFCGIDGHLMGPDYRLRVPYQIELGDMPAMWRQRLDEALVIEGGDIRCRVTPQHPFYCRPQGFGKTDEPQWELVHVPSGVGLREYDDFAPSRVAVWGTTHVISAEVFVAVDLQPGEIQTWSRRYEFFAGPE
ncbi:MAG: hypothetical protein JXA89_28525 [Anaerolineae bacterium]|nr:hypothetical protein [Anaerolineae bacterium]